MNGFGPVESVQKYLPLVVPAAWSGPHHNPVVPSSAMYESTWGLRVIMGVEVHGDGRRWLHVSMSRQERLPSWKELREVKDLFVGKARLALQILPPEKDYVNVHPNCLHLWHCLDGDPTGMYP